VGGLLLVTDYRVRTLTVEGEGVCLRKRLRPAGVSRWDPGPETGLKYVLGLTTLKNKKQVPRCQLCFRWH